MKKGLRKKSRRREKQRRQQTGDDRSDGEKKAKLRLKEEETESSWLRLGLAGISRDVVGLVFWSVVRVQWSFGWQHLCYGYRVDSVWRHGRAVRKSLRQCTLFYRSGLAIKVTIHSVTWIGSTWRSMGRIFVRWRERSGVSAEERKKKVKEDKRYSEKR